MTNHQPEDVSYQPIRLKPSGELQVYGVSFEGQVEKVARAMCVRGGFDPDERVLAGYTSDMTAWERAVVTYTPDVAIYKQRWRLFRGEAANAVVAHEVLAGDGV